VFTVEQRETFRDRVLQFADQDDRVVAEAIVGSLALGGGDRLSDLDLTFAVADHVPVSMVLDDWSMMLSEQLGALRLTDLNHGVTTYRVFLLPDALQFDLSMTPAAAFRPSGPRFRLLFGETVPDEPQATAPPLLPHADDPTNPHRPTRLDRAPS